MDERSGFYTKRLAKKSKSTRSLGDQPEAVLAPRFLKPHSFLP